MPPILHIDRLRKVYKEGLVALGDVSLSIEQGEIFALLGPNGAGKTTLIGIACGLVNATAGRIEAGGHDIAKDFRAARRLIGLVPQELATDSFESVLTTVRFSRGLFGCASDPAVLERVLRQLSLWDKRNAKIMTLSGGMKRRVMIAKALVHEPRILFLDEPSAGVDVELRRGMWDTVRSLRNAGVTIILTTHYIEEAEEMADRIGVINKGELILVEEKAALMRKLGRRELRVRLAAPLAAVPESLAPWALELQDEGRTLIYRFEAGDGHSRMSPLLRELDQLGLAFHDLETRQSSLEDIFVSLLRTAA